MRVLITGACGFVGRHLAAELARHGHELALATLNTEAIEVHGRKHAAVPLDVRDAAATLRVVEEARADAVAHLAGIAHVPTAAKDREGLSAVNIVGVHNVCRAVARTAPVPVLFVSTAFVYGDHAGDVRRVSETTPTVPATPYGASKLAGELVGKAFETEGRPFYVARPFNHTGPGQSPSFVAPGFAQRVLGTPDGGTMDVGNLAAQRDLSDVRDIVRAYRLILEKRPTERLFVLGAGRPVAIRDVLERLIAISGKRIATRVAPELFRPEPPGATVADATRAAETLGWRCEIPLERSLADLYEDIKNRQ